MKLENLKNLIGRLTGRIPAQYRQYGALILIGLIIFLVLYVVVQHEPKKSLPRRVAQHKTVFIPENMDHNLSVSGVTSELEMVRKENKDLKRKLEEMSDSVKAMRGKIPDSNTIRAEVERDLRAELKRDNAQAKPEPPRPAPAPQRPQAQNRTADKEWWHEFQQGSGSSPSHSVKPATTAGSPNPKPTIPVHSPSAADMAKKEALKVGEIRMVSHASQAGGDVKSVHSKDKDGQKSGTYLPAGAIFSGTLLTGLDVTTGEGSRRDPFPVLLRVKKEAILPNRYRADVRECFLISSGWGDLSSERAYLRAERLSCIRNDSKALESKVEMYAVGEDGKAGVRGRVVNKTGSVLGRAMMAGFLEGFGKLFGKQPVMALNTGSFGRTTTTPFQSYMSSDALQSGAVSGMGSAMDRLAKYYIDMAQNIYPVIEVDAGRSIDFVLLHGVSLQLQEGSTTVSRSSGGN